MQETQRSYLSINDIQKEYIPMSKKYHEKLDNIQIRVPKGEKEKISAHAAAQGESLNAFVVRAIKDAIEREQKSVL